MPVSARRQVRLGTRLSYTSGSVVDQCIFSVSHSQMVDSEMIHSCVVRIMYYRDMNALILGGTSLRNKEYVRQIAAALQPHMDKVVYLDYLHWHNGGDQADISSEIHGASRLAADLGNDYVVIGKSVGIVITLYALRDKLLAPKRCVFMGFPLNGLKDDPLTIEALKLLPPTVVLQHEHDPWGSAVNVATFLKQNAPNPVACIALPGDTHEYSELDTIVEQALA